MENLCQKIEVLNLSYTKMEKKSAEMLANILTKNIIKIISLNISGNKFGDKSFSEICIGLSKNKSLTRFFSSDNELSTISSFLIGTILRYDKKLKWLDLSKNKFDDENVTNVYKGIISNNTLEGLVLNENMLTNKCLSVINK
jgi:Ran GTPase-activating protein (RanGAP) involved in mRNA processing and transport